MSFEPLIDIDHPNHWYIPNGTLLPDINGIKSAATERAYRYRKVQVVHYHDPEFPCVRECESIP